MAWRPRHDRRTLALCAIFASASAGCGGSEAPAPELGTAIAVTVQSPRTETLRDVLTFPGAIVPTAAADFTVTAVEVGEIVELPKAEGDAVVAGDLLVRFEIPAITNEIATRQIELTAAKTRADAARAEAQKMESLHARGIASRNAMEASRAAANDADAAVTQVQALVDAARAQEQRTIVRARFDGIVTRVWQPQGAYIATPGEPILRVIDPNRVQVVMPLPLADFQRVVPGQLATVQPPGGPGLQAAVVMRTPPATPGAATAEIRLDLATPPPLAIDTPVQVEILIEERRDVLTIPAAAVQRDSGAPVVWVAGEDGLAHRREVRIGLVAGGRAQVLSGLTPTDQVILTGISELNEGTPIRSGR
jgi:multidrug efflux system membrane fusion protein